LARVEPRLDGLGEELARYLHAPRDIGKQRVLIRASHDVALLKLRERLDPQLAIDLRFESSLDSLDALARGKCDIAGFHLPHPPTLIEPLLAEFGTRLNAREHYVGLLLSRHRGLMVGKGTKRRIRGLGDVGKLNLRFVNRERGSGTRLLFDALLAREGLAPACIKGYEHEEFTHMATAGAVRSGMADIAFGIEAAASAHGLTFVPLVTEHYYLACRRNAPARIAVDTMVATAKSTAFSRAIARIGGYDTKATGSRVQLSELLARS
jgi:putative molybdopterin biosynthesis protein